jgi:HEAT repeat protein
MLAALRGGDLEALRAALVALEAGETPVDAEICAALIELLGHPRKEMSRRAAGALALAAGDPACRVSLEEALTDADERRRWSAAFALARAGVLDDAVVGAALESLGARDGDVRWAAAEIVCAAARERPEVAGAVAAVCGSQVPEQRKMALYCLRDLSAADPAPFIRALDDDDRSVRLAALAGLARYAALETDALARVLRCMRADADAGVRRAAAATAARIAAHDEFAAAALEEAASTSDDRDFVRAAVRRTRGSNQ